MTEIDILNLLLNQDLTEKVKVENVCNEKIVDATVWPHEEYEGVFRCGELTGVPKVVFRAEDIVGVKWLREEKTLIIALKCDDVFDSVTDLEADRMFM